MFLHQGENVRQTHLLRVFRQGHNTVDVGDPSVVRRHVFVSLIVQVAVLAVKHKVSDHREQYEQNRDLIHLIHEDEGADAGDGSEGRAEYDIDRLYQPVVRLFHGQCILIVKFAVLEAFQFDVPGFAKEFAVQAFVYDGLRDGIDPAV